MSCTVRSQGPSTAFIANETSFLDLKRCMQRLLAAADLVVGRTCPRFWLAAIGQGKVQKNSLALYSPCAGAGDVLCHLRPCTICGSSMSRETHLAVDEAAQGLPQFREGGSSGNALPLAPCRRYADLLQLRHSDLRKRRGLP